MLRVGWLLLAVSAIGLLAAPVAILRNVTDLSARSSRHAVAGALGLTALALLELVLAMVPIRRGERWAVVAAGVPFVVVGVPVLLMDATCVAPGRVWRTIAPQLLGLAVGATGWVLCLIGTRRQRPR